jgi:transposase
MLYAGVDTHKKYSHVVVTDHLGNKVAQASIANDQSSFSDFFLKLNKPTRAVVEAGRNWGIIYDLLDSLGTKPTLANPLKTRAIAEAKIKTDSIDARTLADLLRADLIPKVYVPTRQVRAHKDLLRQRLWLVRIRTMVKNRIHHILDRNHVVLSFHSDIFGKNGREEIDRIELPTPDDLLLKAHLEILDQLQAQIRNSDKWIHETTIDNPAVATLRTIPGLGKILSALVALEIDDIRRFHSPGKLCAYSGLVPSTYASGGKVHHGRLISTCNHWLRWAFVEAAWIAQRTSPYCHVYYERIKRRKGTNSAATALARRLCEITWHCLIDNRPYEERSLSVAFFSSWS